MVLADPLTLREERAVAQGLTRLVTLTGLGGECLARRMRLPPGRVEVINHGNLEIATVPLPSLDTLRLLYFGFIYRGKASRTCSRPSPTCSPARRRCASACA